MKGNEIPLIGNPEMENMQVQVLLSAPVFPRKKLKTALTAQIPHDHHSAWRRKQTTAGRRHCCRRRTMAAIHTNEIKMITTRPYSDTIIARIKREPKFARLLYASAINAILEDETAEGLSMLRDLVNAEIIFKGLARQTGPGEKSLHRMLNRNGNPTARNLGVIVKSIAEELGSKPHVEFA
jgi:DNA-binding phage protein